MIASVELSPAIEREIVSAAIALASDKILSDALLTRDEAAALLRVTTKTLNLLPIPRVRLGGATRYRRQDILHHINVSLEK